MKVDNLGAFCNTFDRHLVIISLENQFMVFFLSGRLRQVLLYALISVIKTQNVSVVTLCQSTPCRPGKGCFSLLGKDGPRKPILSRKQPMPLEKWSLQDTAAILEGY